MSNLGSGTVEKRMEVTERVKEKLSKVNFYRNDVDTTNPFVVNISRVLLSGPSLRLIAAFMIHQCTLPHQPIGLQDPSQLSPRFQDFATTTCDFILQRRSSHHPLHILVQFKIAFSSPTLCAGIG